MLKAYIELLSKIETIEKYLRIINIQITDSVYYKWKINCDFDFWKRITLKIEQSIFSPGGAHALCNSIVQIELWSLQYFE